MLTGIKELLIDLEIPVVQGGAAIFECRKRLKIKETGNRIFLFSSSDNSRDGISRRFPNPDKHEYVSNQPYVQRLK